MTIEQVKLIKNGKNPSAKDWNKINDKHPTTGTIVQVGFEETTPEEEFRGLLIGVMLKTYDDGTYDYFAIFEGQPLEVHPFAYWAEIVG